MFNKDIRESINQLQNQLHWIISEGASAINGHKHSIDKLNKQKEQLNNELKELKGKFQELCNLLDIKEEFYIEYSGEKLEEPKVAKRLVKKSKKSK